MNRKLLSWGIVAGAALALAAGQVIAREGKKKKEPKKPENPLAEMAKFSQPGPEHKVLRALAGKWKAEVQFRMGPKGEPMKSEGTMARRLVLGGRFLRELYKSTSPEMPFTGMGMLGYDKGKKKYNAMWTDSMSTAIMVTYGTYDAAKKTFTFDMEMDDPVAKKKTKGRNLIRIIDKDHHVQEMYHQDDKGKEFKAMEIKYSRAK
jgi:hypothetical protein